MSYDPNVNRAVIEAVKTGSFDKIAGYIGGYIRSRIYEYSFAEKILKVRNVDPEDLIPEVDSDTVYVLGQLEVGTDKAITANFQGRPFTVTKKGRRYKIPLGYNTTPIFTKSEIEMLAFDYDLFKDIEEKEVFALHRLRDEKLIAMLNQAVSMSGKQKDYPAPSAGVVVYPEKDHFADLANLLESGDRQGLPDEDSLKCTKFLFSATILNDLARWSSVDVDQMAAELAVKGWASSTLLDKEFIVSTKHDLFVEKDSSGNLWDVIYAFPDPDFIGELIHVNGYDISSEMWKRDGTTEINRRSSEFYGAGIGNYKGVAKIRLQRGTI